MERMGVGVLLRRAGYEVAEVGDGKSAVVELKKGDIDLLLLDLQMPDMDGFDVLGYVQNHRPGLPVILLSGMSLDQIQHKMHNLPTQELPPLLIKPVDPGQLLQVVSLQLNGGAGEGRTTA